MTQTERNETRAGATPTKATKREEQSRIMKAWWRLEGICGHSHDWDRYNTQNEAEEREHRRGRSGPYGISAANAARLFVVKYILDYRIEGAKIAPNAADIFHMKLSCFQGYALFVAHREKIRVEFGIAESKSLCSIDYAEHMKA